MDRAGLRAGPPPVGLGAIFAADPQFWHGGFSGYLVQSALGFLGVASTVGLVLELTIVSALLVAFDKYRWPWLNGWTGAALGFVIGASSWFVLAGYLLGGLAPAEIDGGVEALRMETADEATIRAIRAMLTFGAAGLVSAVVFRGIAVRRVRAGS